MTPVYLSQIYELKEKDSETWQFFMKGYFSINKTSVSFIATGADQAIEHENRTMKVLGRWNKKCCKWHKQTSQIFHD